MPGCLIRSSRRSLGAVKIVAHARTDVGQWRPANEDSHVVLEESAVFAVADGMGGHAAGEIASRIAVDTVSALIDSRFQDSHQLLDLLQRVVNQANNAIAQAALATPEHAGMGTTLTVLGFDTDGNAAAFAHVGDSRLYHLRAGRLQQVTRDHTWVQEQVNHGRLTAEQARSHPMSSMLTRALGTQEEVEIESGFIHPESGDVFLLCSDGLTNMITDDEIAAILQNPPPIATQQLIDRANEEGGRDNITALVVRVA
jgi:PPM family protein phosphatase